jgi:hypothetical protein
MQSETGVDEQANEVTLFGKFDRADEDVEG